MRGMVVGEGGCSSGVLLYHQKMKLVLDIFCFHKLHFFDMIMDRITLLQSEIIIFELVVGPFTPKSSLFWKEDAVTKKNVTADLSIQQIETYSKYHSKIHINY